MNRAEFIDEIAKCKGISHEKAYQSVNAVMDTIRLVLMKGEEIEIGGFGTFGMVIDLKGERIPVFSPAQPLKHVLNSIQKEERD